MTAFVLTPLAARDLGDIWNYLAEDNLQAADRVLLALEKAMNKLPGVLASAISEKILLINDTGSCWFIRT